MKTASDLVWIWWTGASLAADALEPTVIYNLYWVFDVRTSDDPGWHPYDEVHYPHVEGEGRYVDWEEHLGWNEFSDFYEQHPAEWVQRALGPIAHRVGTGLNGVRVRVWKDRSGDEVPDMIVEATPLQIGQARIRAAAYVVQQTQQALQEAQDALRETVVSVDLRAPLGNTPGEAAQLIDKDVSKALPGEDLASFLTGARIATQIQRALVARGLSDHCFDADLEGYERQFGGVHSYWAGCIRFVVKLDGTVVVTLHPDGEPWQRLSLDDPEAERREVEAEQAAQRGLASEHAALLAEVLGSWRVGAFTEDGAVVEAAQLATVPSFTLRDIASGKSAATV